MNKYLLTYYGDHIRYSGYNNSCRKLIKQMEWH